MEAFVLVAPIEISILELTNKKKREFNYSKHLLEDRHELNMIEYGN